MLRWQVTKQHPPTAKTWSTSHMSVLHLLPTMFQRYLTSCLPLATMSMLSSKSEITKLRQGWHWIARQTLILKLAFLALTYKFYNLILYLRIVYSLRIQGQKFWTQDRDLLPRLNISGSRRPMVRISGPLALDWSIPNYEEP